MIFCKGLRLPKGHQLFLAYLSKHQSAGLLVQIQYPLTQ